MSARKSERLLNLLISLLVTRTFLSKQQIRQLIEPYRDASDEAFEKMFERDKEEMRQLGIPVEMGSFDPLFDDAVGYRIPRSAYELPEINLAPDEAAVVGLAARVWQHAGLAEATADAVLKLRAAGIDTDAEALDIAQPQLGAAEPCFEALWDATVNRTHVEFDYRTGSGVEVEHRTVDPWGLAMVQGRWYLAGFDRAREEPRVFRLSRVIGEVTVKSKSASYDVPADFDLRAAMASVAPAEEVRSATLRLRPGKALGFRTRASAVSAEGDWDVVEVPFGRASTLVDEVLGYGSDVVVIAPDDVRSNVIERLREVAR
jgi:proteasome accessory factor B